MARELILASTSESRRSVLDAAGVVYRAVAPDYSEVHRPGLEPDSLAKLLAVGKAQSVASRFPDALVIGADQLLWLDGELLRKPESETQARVQLRQLSGRRHTLTTGVALVCLASGWEEAEHETSWLTLRPLSDPDIERYLRTGEWQGCVGSYRVEGEGLKLFQQLEGDWFNARGLPLLRLCAMLRRAGFEP